MTVAREGRAIGFCRVCREHGLQRRALPGKELCAECWNAVQTAQMEEERQRAEETTAKAVATRHPTTWQTHVRPEEQTRWLTEAGRHADWPSLVRPVCNSLASLGKAIMGLGCLSCLAALVWSALGGGVEAVLTALASLGVAFMWHMWHTAGAMALELLALIAETNMALAKTQCPREAELEAQ
jgi:hypothetical protein